MSGEPRAPSHRAERAPLRLLVVDDDAVDRMSVRRLLRQAGVAADIDEAVDFDSAREALLHTQADCVLLDFDLPGGNGQELLQLAAASGVRTPIIVLTGRGHETLAVDLMKVGAVDYMPKRMLSAEGLWQSIRQAIRMREVETRAAKAHEALEHQASRLLLLSSSSLGLHAAVTVEETLKRVVALARGLTGANIAVARIALGQDQRTEMSQSRAQSATLPPLVEGDLAEWEPRIWQSRGCVVLSEASLEEQSEWNAKGRLKGLLAAPLFGREGGPIGSLLVTDYVADPFTKSDASIFVQLAQTASVALESSRLYREAQDATRARDDLLAIVSHDLRSPLGVVRLSADLLRPVLEKTPEAEHIHRIDRGVQRMSRLIEDLLFASRIDAGALRPDPAKVSASSLISDALEFAEPLAKTRRCRLSVPAQDAAIFVLADRARMAQVFSNIIGNSLKYVTDDAGIITLSLLSDGPRVWFMLSDNGPGIPPGFLPHVFKRGLKAHSAERDGAGLGLYIAKGIVDAHGGTIEVESAPGAGTTVRFWLPRI